jgi:hypothetical protein
MLSNRAAILAWAASSIVEIAAELPTCARALSIAVAKASIATVARADLTALWRSLQTGPQVKIGLRRTLRFISLITHLRTAPWAAQRFGPNDKMVDRLIATHLRIIVGEAAYREERESIIALLDDTKDNEMQNTENILWLTSRQNGKTTVLGLFAAALTSLGRPGGELLNVYSTNLDRAMQVSLGHAARVWHKYYINFGCCRW